MDSDSVITQVPVSQGESLNDSTEILHSLFPLIHNGHYDSANNKEKLQ